MDLITNYCIFDSKPYSAYYKKKKKKKKKCVRKEKINCEL